MRQGDVQREIDNPQEGPPPRSRVKRLILADFRSYATLDLTVAGRRIALTGDNGAGKTNILEALSLFAPGRGLRRADFVNCAREGGGGGWSASIEIDSDGASVRLGTGLAGAGEPASTAAPETESMARPRRQAALSANGSGWSG